MGGRRAEKVGRQIVEALGQAVSRGLADPSIGLVTFTEADVSDDLRNARIFYSVLGDDQAREDCRIGLKRASGFLRRQVAQALSLRYAPQLRFEFDETLARAARIDSLLAPGAPALPQDSDRDPEVETVSGGDQRRDDEEPSGA